MTREDKAVAIEDLKGLLQDAKVIYVADLEGLNAGKSSDFRRQAFKNNITVKVVKNTLLRKALEQIEGVDFSEMFDTFKGNSALMIADTANAPAKLIKDFRKKDEKPALKSAYVQEMIYVGDNQLDALANIKSKEEMLGEIIGLLQSPIQRLVSALQNKADGGEATSDEATTDTPTEADAAPATENETPAAE